MPRPQRKAARVRRQARHRQQRPLEGHGAHRLRQDRPFHQEDRVLQAAQPQAIPPGVPHLPNQPARDGHRRNATHPQRHQQPDPLVDDDLHRWSQQWRLQLRRLLRQARPGR
uniref:(northern house mosquito) hypothetical protein n=1 Tax=Culex pipiens TaxID=7175 RepID=A0A8D8CLD4_CULPI